MMGVSNPTNPRFADQEGTAIILDVQIDGLDGEHPFAARADDVEQHGRDLFAQALAGDFGPVAAYAAPLPTVSDYQAAIVAMLDGAAQERRYDNGLSLSTYTGSTNPTWAAEAQAYVAWRDAVWAYAYAELDKVMAGQREQPSVEGFLSELPQITWPA